jgi:hypothetical protein
MGGYCHRRKGQHADGVSIGSGFGKFRDSESPGTTNLVRNDNPLPQFLVQNIRQGPNHQVGAAAGVIDANQIDWFFGKIGSLSIWGIANQSATNKKDDARPNSNANKFFAVHTFAPFSFFLLDYKLLQLDRIVVLNDTSPLSFAPFTFIHLQLFPNG